MAARLKIILLLFISLFLVSCGDIGLISYNVINNTEYDVSIIDNYDIDKPTYSVPANTTITIKHNNSAHFELQNNTHPIEIQNMFSCSYINYLPEHEYEIINSTDKAYSLVISNPKYGAGTFSIPGDTTTTIKTYENNPVFQLYDGPSLVENHMVKENNKIVIY